MLVAVLVVLPLVGGLIGHWLADGPGARGAIVMFSCLALAYVAWYARREQETDVTRGAGLITYRPYKGPGLTWTFPTDTRSAPGDFLQFPEADHEVLDTT